MTVLKSTIPTAWIIFMKWIISHAICLARGKSPFIQTDQISFQILLHFHLCSLAVPFRQLAFIYLYEINWPTDIHDKSSRQKKKSLPDAEMHINKAHMWGKCDTRWKTILQLEIRLLGLYGAMLVISSDWMREMTVCPTVCSGCHYGALDAPVHKLLLLQ